jgi:integrase
MSKRRGAGEGSIFRRADGRWCGQIELPRSADGRRRRKTVYGRTRAEVQETLLAIRKKGDSGHSLESNPRMTVAEYSGEWLDSRRIRVSPATWLRDESIMRLHVVPSIGQVKMRGLTPQHISRLLETKSREMSPRSVGHLLGTLKKMLNSAAMMNLIEYNPAMRVPRPRVVSSQRGCFTAEEARRYLSEARGHKFEAAFMLALIHGMRLGEILGLRWSNINWEHQSLSITTSLAQDFDGSFQLGPTKNHRSTRPIQLADSVLTALRNRKAIQNKERLECGPNWVDNDLVFARPDGTPLSKTNFGRANHYPLVYRADVPRITFHDLRHTAATLGLLAGTNPKVIQEMLGHKSISVTMDIYSHVMPSTHRAAANAIAASVGL